MKVFVVFNIGIIVVGIVKVGVDFINISGFDGGIGVVCIYVL